MALPALRSDACTAAARRAVASEVADGSTVRLPSQSAPVVDFKRYDRAPEIFRSLTLGAREASTGVYVRATVPFSLRLIPGRDLVPEPSTGVVFAQRARVSVFTERDPAWPKNSGQIIIVAMLEPGRPSQRATVALGLHTAQPDLSPEVTDSMISPTPRAFVT